MSVSSDTVGDVSNGVQVERAMSDVRCTSSRSVQGAQQWEIHHHAPRPNGTGAREIRRVPSAKVPENAELVALEDFQFRFPQRKSVERGIGMDHGVDELLRARIMDTARCSLYRVHCIRLRGL